MTEITLYLFGFAVVLFLIVLLLEVSKPARPKQAQSPADDEVKVYFNKEIASESRLPADYSVTEQLIALEASMQGLKKKTEMAHSRLNDLEQEIIESKSSGRDSAMLIPLEKRVEPLEEKLEKLDNFRANTEVEIKALKEILSSQISSRPYSANYDRLKKQDDEYLQSVIFNSRVPRGKALNPKHA